jgi:succinate-semialdehyde dehydrogenase/glutarate-semialdehyde dehydrogenase
VEEILNRASRAQAAWARTPLANRAAVLRAAAGILRQDLDALAGLITSEMGKPISESRAEIEKCAWVAEFYADRAPAFLRQEPVPTEAHRSFVRFDPLGTVLSVMPWNFPFWQVFRFAAPALAAGNGALLKHASNVPGCALAIEDLFLRAGAPEGVFSTLLLASSRVAALVADSRVAAVTLTGSSEAGAAVASAAGKAAKKSVLELGGSDPFVVLADADLDRAVEAAVTSRLINTGQSCIAAKRFILEAPVAGEFTRRFTDALVSLPVGDPALEGTRLGPLARADLVEDLHRQVCESARGGARILTGGKPLDRPGFFYAPTVLADVAPGMPAWEEETFGPLAALAAARDAEEALSLANQTPFGLGAALWTADLDRADRLVPRIQAGAVFVNGFVKSDPRLPFGGVKASGYGRELASYGIREFVNVKAVWMDR